MRRSPCAVQILSAAASADASATMSSLPTYRGGRSRGRRGFCDRSYKGGGRDQLVTGDSHFQSVSEANLGFRQGGRGGRESSSNFSQRPHPRPHFNHVSSFCQPPPPRQPFRQPRPPPFSQNQRRQLRPKPSDFREWEYAKPPPPPGSERFVVLSYNILADYLAIKHQWQLYRHIPNYMLDWDWRKRSIMFELGLWSADIMCLQEVDRFQDLEEELKHRGYSGIWKMRTGNAVDGCAIFWRSSRFKLVQEESIEFNKLGLRDNVAQICVLELVNPNHTKNEATPPTSSAGSRQAVICNIHVLYNPKRGDFKLGQVRMLLERAHAVSRIWNNAPVVLCGDFNCTPKSPLYNFISEQKLDLSGLDRDKVSGQASAEIRASRPYNSNPVFMSPSNSVQVPSLENNSNCNEDNVPPINILESQCSETMLVGSEVTFHSNQISSSEHSHLNANPENENTECDNSKSLHVAEDLSSVTRSNPEHQHTFNTEISSREGFSQTSVLDVFEESLPSLSTEVDYLLNKKLDNSPLEEPDESVKGVGLDEDDKTFLSALHGDESGQFVRMDRDLLSPSEEVSNDFSPDLDSEALSSEKTAYDPALWTPMEIATATGNPDSTFMEHHLELKSTYTEVEDLSNTRDINGEPSVTSYNKHFMGTVDYIWRSEGLQTVRVLAPLPKHAMQWTGGFPTKKWGSDHIALASELAFVKDQSDCDNR